MKTLLLLAALTCAVLAQPFDPVRARQVGADEYGMRQYVLAFLKRGPHRDPEKAAALQRSHLDNIHRLAQEGKLILAGPFTDDGELRGIYLFKTSDLEEARRLTETDPAVQAGSLILELHPWYGPAGLMELPQIQPKVTEKQI